MRGASIVLAPRCYRSVWGKTAHGLIRRSTRFDVKAVVDPDCAGEDAGVLLDGEYRGIPVVESVDAACAQLQATPKYAVVGVATSDGKLTEEIRHEILCALNAGMSIVNGLHQQLGEDGELRALADSRGATITDVRKVKGFNELHKWTGKIYGLPVAIIPIVGTDIAIGKRTTAALVVEACRAAGIRAEMIYTGQTGWLQGWEHGFVLDSTVHDFMEGELEHAILQCYRDKQPAVIVIEGQSGLMTPSGPDGHGLLLAGRADAAILQHHAGRSYYLGSEHLRLAIPSVEHHVRLVSAYGFGVIGVTLNCSGLTTAQAEEFRDRLQAELGVPVTRPLEEGVSALIPAIRRLAERRQGDDSDQALARDRFAQDAASAPRGRTSTRNARESG